jgi:Icc-related predicted phosphoesterase
MGIRIGHFSDLHSNIIPLLEYSGPLPDLWVSTGDFLPNISRGDRAVDVPVQTEWLEKVIPDLREAFGQRPVLCQEGNHDHISIAPIFQQNGILAFQVHKEKRTINVAGKDWTYAGFREIPYIVGEWEGEADDATMREIVRNVMVENPDLLICHAPPAGILDNRYSNSKHGVFGYGIQHLTSSLMYQEHQIQCVMFGHIHNDHGGQTHQGITFSNAATVLRFVEIE